MPTMIEFLPYLLRYMNPTRRRRGRSRSFLPTGRRGGGLLPMGMVLAIGFGLGYFGKDYIAAETVMPEVVRPAGSMSWQVYFSPNGGCTDAVVREIRAAKTEIRVMAYSFTSKPIATALVDASKRGVDVKVILDKSQQTANYSEADFLSHSKIPTFIDDRHAIQHNKVIIIDSATVITGSFNFSSAAETRNAENLVIFRDNEMAHRYLANWSMHQQHSQIHQAR